MLKYEKDKEKAAFKEMSFRKKLEHIFEYYRLTIVLSLVGIAMVAWGLNHYIINPPKDPSVNVTAHAYFVDTDVLQELKAELDERFPEFTTDDTEISMLYNSTGLDEDQAEPASVMKMMVNMAAGEIDVLTGGLEEIYSDAFNSYMMPLEDIFTEEELAKIAELAPDDEESGNGIYYVQPGEMNANAEVVFLDEHPFFVNISNSEILKRLIGQDSVYIGFAGNCKHLEEAKAIFWYLLEGK